MKHKEKRLEYVRARPYQTMSAKEWEKNFLSEEKFNLDGLDTFQKYWYVKKNSRRELLNKV